jgi:putative hemolysin
MGQKTDGCGEKMTVILVEVGIVLFLILINGILAMSEIAIVSARRPRLQQRAAEGEKGARLALDLAAAPERFLSTVQIGITLVGILAGAFAGATIAKVMSEQLGQVPFLAPYSDALSVALMVIAVTYLSVVLGELVPKTIGLNSAERVAVKVAGPMMTLSVIAYPIVRLLSSSTQAVTRLLGIRDMTQPEFTKQELLIMMEEGAEAGLLKQTESEMVEQVFRLSDRRVSTVMVHRTNIVWLDLDESRQTWTRQIIEQNHTLLPVARGDLDAVVGIVRAKDLLVRALAQQPLELEANLVSPLFLPESMPILSALDEFRERQLYIGLVIDEHGGVQGLVTLTDLLEEIVGDLPRPDEEKEARVTQCDDGSWWLDGLLPIDEFKALLHIPELPGETQGLYETLGGFVMWSMGRIPAPGDHFNCDTVRFEVTDMDGLRVDKVLVEHHGDETGQRDAAQQTTSKPAG